MKTSNKILLALFLLPFILTTFLSFALYAKFKSGDYITQEQLDNETSVTKSLHAFTTIDLRAFQNGHVTIKRADSFSVKYDKWLEENISYNSEGGLLTVKTTNNEGYHVITINCPSFANLSINNLELFIDVMPLSNSTIEVGESGNVMFNGQADSLTLDIKHGGNISFQNKATVNTLNLRLENGAAFNKTEGFVKHVGEALLGDSASLNIDGKTMRMILGSKSSL